MMAQTVADTPGLSISKPHASAECPVVEIRGLRKKFGGKPVIDGLSLKVKRGSVYGLIGPNGAGKSTTLKILMRMIEYQEGSVSILGHEVSDEFRAVKRRIGYVPESHFIYPWMKVSQVIRFTSSFYDTWNDDLCQQLLTMFRLEPRKKTRQLSKGMLAKLALLLAISHEPDLLLLDEPLNGLDPIVREEFLDGVLRSICDNDTSVLFSSHSMDDVQRVADSVGILYDGRLLTDSSVDDLLLRSKRLRVVSERGAIDWLPDSTVSVQTIGRETTVSVSDFSPLLLEEFQAKNRISATIEDVSLEEAFKDCIRGSREKESRNGELQSV